MEKILRLVELVSRMKQLNAHEGAKAMNWQDLPKPVLDTMKFVGDFSPTSVPEQKFVKGYMYDEDGGGKCYLDSNDLREMAEHFIVVADWLDKRAEAA